MLRLGCASALFVQDLEHSHIILTPPACQIKAHNDYAVIGLNSLHMFLGGIIFSLTFSMATDHFRTKPARTLASTLMNIIYYVAMAVGMGISFAMTA
jgi:hypothetical protein